MPKLTKVCRVCGKTYEACRSIRNGSSVFNWREVACSPECGAIYFKQVEAARSQTGGERVDVCFAPMAEEVAPVLETAEKDVLEVVADEPDLDEIWHGDEETEPKHNRKGKH